MPNGIEDYCQLVSEPWGRMFYDIIFTQLRLPDEKPLRILDFGSGFGVTANHFAAVHEVYAVEPNPLMSDRRFKENVYAQITGSVETLEQFTDEFFDVVICHNVLEYCDDQKGILHALLRILNTEGLLSVVKHNENGKILRRAVSDANPEHALKLLEDIRNDRSTTFGKRSLYSNSDISQWCFERNAYISSTYGIETFFSLIKYNGTKYSEAWYAKMLELEIQVSGMEDFQRIAYFNHLIIIKRQDTF